MRIETRTYIAVSDLHAAIRRCIRPEGRMRIETRFLSVTVAEFVLSAVASGQKAG